MFDNAKHREDINTIVEMHSYKRPHQSKGERKFIARFLRPLGVERDSAGNVIKRIGTDPVLWSCHTDTVDWSTGRRYTSVYDGILSLAKTDPSHCLGADDGAGCWLMREMIKAGKEGLYVFHAGEEKGGIGSNHIARKTPELLNGIQAAIAFDRTGYTDVITHQLGGRSASDAFAESLAKELGGKYKPSSNGIYTDTANYTGLVPECTNISVGQFNQHTKDEQLDMVFLIALRDTLLALDTSKLVISRKPTDDLYDGYPRYKGRSTTCYSVGKVMDDYLSKDNRDAYDIDDAVGHVIDLTGRVAAHDDLRNYRYTRLIDVVRDYPDEMVAWLEDQGYDAETLLNEVMRHCYGS
jgi:peptidase M28-like protein